VRETSMLAAVVMLFAITGSNAEVPARSGTFILHLVAKPAGKETYSLTGTPLGLQLKSHFEYDEIYRP